MNKNYINKKNLLILWKQGELRELNIQQHIFGSDWIKSAGRHRCIGKYKPVSGKTIQVKDV